MAMGPKDADRIANSDDPDQIQSEFYSVCLDLSAQNFRVITATVSVFQLFLFYELD